METYGIIGNPLGHSFSKRYFTDKFEANNIDAEFLNFELPNIQDLPNVLEQHSGIKGLCVTIPYKQDVLPFLDEIDPLAQRIGAVNSIRIVCSENQTKLIGYNTDIYGFSESLKVFLNGLTPKALILGTGGASKAIATGLEELGIAYCFVSRFATKNALSYEMLSPKVIAEYKLIVNCSPLGTFPKVDACPNIPYQLLTADHFLYDLVYNPDVTLFLKKGEEQGAKIHNGLKMLHLQAEKSWKIWNL